MSISDQYWALPDGISEALPEEAARLEKLRREILDLYGTWGYQLVIPPLVEYMQSLTTGAGSNLDVQTFKITDQQSGHMMGIRADMTPQIARIDAHKLKSNGPARLCYIGSVLRTRPLKQGGPRSPLQVGAELFGHAGLDSDLEILSLLLTTLHHCGIQNLTLDLGHVGVFRGLSEQAGLSTEQEATFFDQVQRKALPEIDGWLIENELEEPVSSMLAALPRLHGPLTVLEQARSKLAAATPAVHEALDYVQELGERLQRKFPTCKLHVDLTELSGYDYHTGIVYAVYSHETGSEVARGGRYDGVGEAFGRARPATGFSTDLRILNQFQSDTTSTQKAVLAPANSDLALEQLISDLRQQGHCVIQQLSGSDEPNSPQTDYQQHIVQTDGQWNVRDI